MGDPFPQPGIFVSLQAPAEGPAAEAHRGTGTLLTPDLVVVPGFPRGSVEEAHTYHVLLAGLPPQDGRAVERIGISYLEAHGVESADGDVALVLALARSAVLPTRTSRTCTSGQLAEGLRARAGDLRSTLADLGAPGLGEALDPDEMLRDLRAVPIGPARRPARLVLHPDLDDIALSICWWVPWCHPHWPGGEEP
jgi:hypothetical protein